MGKIHKGRTVLKLYQYDEFSFVIKSIMSTPALLLIYIVMLPSKKQKKNTHSEQDGIVQPYFIRNPWKLIVKSNCVIPLLIFF
jgi:hypothetical protein